MTKILNENGKSLVSIFGAYKKHTDDVVRSSLIASARNIMKAPSTEHVRKLFDKHEDKATFTDEIKDIFGLRLPENEARMEILRQSLESHGTKYADIQLTGNRLFATRYLGVKRNVMEALVAFSQGNNGNFAQQEATIKAYISFVGGMQIQEYLRTMKVHKPAYATCQIEAPVLNKKSWYNIAIKFSINVMDIAEDQLPTTFNRFVKYIDGCPTELAMPAIHNMSGIIVDNVHGCSPQSQS